MKITLNNKTLELILFSLLALLCCYSILPNGIQSIVIIVFSTLAIVFNYKHIKGEVTKAGGITLWLIIIFWIIILSLTLLYSIELKFGLSTFRKLINIIIIPFVILYALPFLNRRKIEKILLVFVLSNIFFVFYLFYYLLDNIFNLIAQHNITINNYSELIWYGIKKGYPTPILIHKTYFSMNMLFSISFLLWYLINKKVSYLKKVLIAIGLFLMGFTIIFFLSKINTFLLLILPVFFLLKKRKIKYKASIIIVYFTSLGILLLFANNIFKNFNKDSFLENTINRKLNFIENVFFTNSSIDNKDIDKRAVIYKCARSLIIEKPFFGYGVGAQHIYLTGCYASNKEFVLYNENFSSHNYYYYLLLCGGIFVLVPFLCMGFTLFKLSFLKKDILLFIFLLIVFSNLLVENTFLRINGVLFFAVILPILIRFLQTKTDKEDGNIL